MKRISFIIAFVFTLFVSKYSYSQSALYGTWTVNCLIEKTSLTTFTFCDICKYENSKDKSCLNVVDFELSINKENLIVSQSGIKETLTYIFNTENDILEFNFKGKTYKFSVLFNGFDDSVILKSEDADILFLKKKI